MKQTISDQGNPLPLQRLTPTLELFLPKRLMLLCVCVFAPRVRLESCDTRSINLQIIQDSENRRQICPNIKAEGGHRRKHQLDRPPHISERPQRRPVWTIEIRSLAKDRQELGFQI
jgi:hypothetical protein